MVVISIAGGTSGIGFRRGLTIPHPHGDATAIESHAEDGWSIFNLPSGRSDFVEVFGPEHANASVFPAEVSKGIVVAFAVDDIIGAREELAAAKVELIGGLVWASELFDDPNMEGFGWFFFRAPDGNVYVMQQNSGPTLRGVGS
jgi:hypothetical protein